MEFDKEKINFRNQTFFQQRDLDTSQLSLITHFKNLALNLPMKFERLF